MASASRARSGLRDVRPWPRPRQLCPSHRVTILASESAWLPGLLWFGGRHACLTAAAAAGPVAVLAMPPTVSAQPRLSRRLEARAGRAARPDARRQGHLTAASDHSAGPGGLRGNTVRGPQPRSRKRRPLALAFDDGPTGRRPRSPTWARTWRRGRPSCAGRPARATRRATTGVMRPHITKIAGSVTSIR